MQNNSPSSFYDKMLQVARRFFALKPSQSPKAEERSAQAPVLKTSIEDSAQPQSDTHQSAPAQARTLDLSLLNLGEFHKIDTLLGEGELAFAGADVRVHYTGWLIDSAAADLKGAKFDSSVDRGQTFNFPLGAGRVIRGWDEGFEGMRIGGKRTLLIPPEMGYGARGAGGVIPPNATLMFEVELLGVN